MVSCYMNAVVPWSCNGQISLQHQFNLNQLKPWISIAITIDAVKIIKNNNLLSWQNSRLLCIVVAVQNLYVLTVQVYPLIWDEQFWLHGKVLGIERRFLSNTALRKKEKVASTSDCACRLTFETRHCKNSKAATLMTRIEINKWNRTSWRELRPMILPDFFLYVPSGSFRHNSNFFGAQKK